MIVYSWRGLARLRRGRVLSAAFSEFPQHALK
jgi:hypothetical protein